jgi:hypothetical protein
MLRYYESENETIKLRCILKCSGNFIYKKIYEVKALSRKRGKYTDYMMSDEDGDYRPVFARDIGVLFEIIK